MYMTGAFIVSYGQYMFSWQASHFDGLLVNKIAFADFLKGKYLLFTIISTAFFLLATHMPIWLAYAGHPYRDVFLEPGS